MASILKQKDLILTFKKETILNTEILSKLHPTSQELNRFIHKGNWLEKPTQSLFNHLSYYYVNIIDHHTASSLPWPLYDTKSERAYRSMFSNFINDYTSKGLLSPIMSSYLVNPGCYKVTMLLLQLSQLAVQHMLTSRISDSQKILYSKVTEKYKNNDEDFIECVDSVTQKMFDELSDLIYERETLEKIAELFRKRITEMEAKLKATDAQNFINNLIDKYIDKYRPHEEYKLELLKIKDVRTPCKFFDTWLTETDNVITKLETDWDNLIIPLLKPATSAMENSKELLGRRTGEIDRKLFTVEYNSQTDAIPTKELQELVNSEQKYILRNIVKEEQLNYPNLIRSFLIAISYILKNNEIGNEIYMFNEYLDNGVSSYSEINSAMKMLNQRVLTAESKLSVAPTIMIQSQPSKKINEIPPLPDLSILKTHRDKQFLLENFTPLRISKHDFNLRRKANLFFNKPQTKSLTTLFSIPKEDFLRTRISSRLTIYDKHSTTQSVHNLSLMSNGNKANETIAECSSGFTAHQIAKLLSTKKTSSSKKFKFKSERPEKHIQKGGLFNESISSNESRGLFRCHSSPNLFENSSILRHGKMRPRKLSIMQEDSPNSLLEVSGIAMLDKNSNFNTPQSSYGLDNTNISNQSMISTTVDTHSLTNDILNGRSNLNKEIVNGSIGLEKSHDENRLKLQELQANNVTPKTNEHLITKSSSLEKIINRYKKVRASAVSSMPNQTPKIIKTIAEEKEHNIDIADDHIVAASKMFLPDVVKPSVRVPETIDDWCQDFDDDQPRRPRESLGTVLGVDHTFLDTCEYID